MKETKDSQKYNCYHCGEIFEVLKKVSLKDLACPRCYSPRLAEYNLCSLEILPPPWEFKCRQCQAGFRVTAPKGPDEAASILCPVCRSRDVQWVALSTAACGTGG